MEQFLHITVNSPDPFERGRQYGEQAAALIRRGIRGCTRHFRNLLGKNWEEITQKSACYLPLLERDFPQELEEARGIAAGSGVSRNHMAAGAAVCANKGKKFRDRILRALLEVRRGTVDLPYIQGCMCSHQTVPGLPTAFPEADSIEAVCTRVPQGEYGPDRVWQTIASAVYDLKGGVAHICKGNLCDGEYVAYRL